MPDFGTPFSGLRNDRNLDKEEIIRAIRFLIAAEYEAVQLYTQLADSIKDSKVENVLRDIAEEEVVHAGEFLRLLVYLRPEEFKSYLEGIEETEDILKRAFTDIKIKTSLKKVIDMPNPNKFKNEKEWMSACMHQLLKVEKKDHDEAVAQCLNMWRQRKKKAMKVINKYREGASINMEDTKNKEAAHRVLSAYLKKESLYGEPLSPAEVSKIKRLRKREQQHQKGETIPSTPLSEEPLPKVGEVINEFIDGEFKEITVTEEYLNHLKNNKKKYEWLKLKGKKPVLTETYG